MHYVQGKGYVEESGTKVCSKREMALQLARVHGANGDTAAFTRLLIESRVSRAAMDEAFRAGATGRAG